jgi:hypothetical protein
MPIPAAVIAAIIGAVATAAASEKQRQGQQQAGTAGAAEANKGGMTMKPAFNDPEKVYGANAKTGQLPSRDPEAEAWLLEQGQPAGTIQSAEPAIKTLAGATAQDPKAPMQEEVDRANARENVGVKRTDMMQRYPLTPTEAEQFGTGNLLTPDFGASGEDITKSAPKEGMTFDEKMQYAALAASLGSTLAGPGPPNPPGAPRGGGINMAPVFQQLTARGLYG